MDYSLKFRMIFKNDIIIIGLSYLFLHNLATMALAHLQEIDNKTNKTKISQTSKQKWMNPAHYQYLLMYHKIRFIHFQIEKHSNNLESLQLILGIS